METVEELEKKMHHITELEYLEAKGETLNFDQQVLLALYVLLWLFLIFWLTDFVLMDIVENMKLCNNYN